ncbi:TetR/AcrR family transcriptional regulator [Mycolicibacterium vinylchloridicum]|uniref:TetR/AcrR family transcriptional regulator n=1 Tax=Mycolicibacterium vinylchloridicum TaxID=2736928 RepID=UPI002D8088E5|nr:helix-turn-helix domain-containing protein [Mycolicibacterium vinylchloridicum]
MATLHFWEYPGVVIPGAHRGAERSRPLRADAERNRERIVTAAARLFAEQGLSVPLEDVARAAGVGVATLYRRFPTRTDLAIAAFERNMTSYEDAVDKALGNPVAWDGFRDLVYEVCELQASDPGLRALLTTAFPASSVIEQRATEAIDKLGRVIVRAQQDGTLRPDIGVGDIVVMLLADAGVLEATREHAPQAWRRFAALMVDAFRVGPHEPLPPPTPPEQLRSSIAMLTGDTLRIEWLADD